MCFLTSWTEYQWICDIKKVKKKNNPTISVTIAHAFFRGFGTFEIGNTACPWFVQQTCSNFPAYLIVHRLIFSKMTDGQLIYTPRICILNWQSLKEFQNGSRMKHFFKTLLKLANGFCGDSVLENRFKIKRTSHNILSADHVQYVKNNMVCCQLLFHCLRMEFYHDGPDGVSNDGCTYTMLTSFFLYIMPCWK